MLTAHMEHILTTTCAVIEPTTARSVMKTTARYVSTDSTLVKTHASHEPLGVSSALTRSHASPAPKTAS